MIKRAKDPSLDPEITLLDETQEQLHQQGFSPPRVWTANFSRRTQIQTIDDPD